LIDLPQHEIESVTKANLAPALHGVSQYDGLFHNIANIDKQVSNTFKLKGDLGNFLGDLETYKLAITLEGDQGAGKTQLSFQLADGFADIGYSVGMFQLEIGANSNIIKRNRDQYIQPKNIGKIAITGEAPEGIRTIRQYAHQFNVIIIDSWTKLDVDSSEFDQLRKDYPDTIWIVLFQRTTTNKIRGGTKPLYDAGINIEVVKADDTFVNNYAVATKNRYGFTGVKYNIYQRKNVS
jgi:nucleoside-triphosphatase THEP1